MTPQQRFFFIGLILNSALYLVSCVGIGYLTGNQMAWKAGVASMGLGYVAYAAQLASIRRDLCFVFVLASVGAGVVSGLALLARW